MANTYTTLDNLFTAMANAIRSKNGGTDSIVADTFPTEIRSLKTGFDYINHNVTEIKDYQFKNCTDLKSVDCYGLTSIGTGAFEGCTELETVVLYDGVQSVGENAFKGCSNTTIYCMFDEQSEGWHENWNSDGCNVVYLGGAVKTWDTSATENDKVTAKLYNDINNDGYYKLIISGNGNMKNYSSKEIPWYNYQTNIKFAIIVDSVTNIGINAFRNCKSLTSITIPNSVTSINQQAFSSCYSLTSIIIPDSVTIIDNNVFEYCKSLTSITIPNSVTGIGSSTFKGCTSLTYINIHDSVTIIGRDAFEDTAYYNDSSNWTNDVLYIGNYLLNVRWRISGDCTVKDGTTVIARYAFNDCELLTSVNIPNSITSVSNSAFSYCYNLISITIPNSVISIDSYAFSSCKSITSINYIGTIAQWNSITFSDYWNNDTGNYTIYCTDGTITKDGTVTYYSTGGES